MSIGPKALTIAAVLGAGLVLVIVRPWADDGRPRAPAVPSDAPRALSPAVAPAAVRNPPAAAATAHATPPIGAALDDDALARHASEQYGFDCPRVVAREERRAGYQDVTCSSGLQLRVYDADGAAPRIGAVH